MNHYIFVVLVVEASVRIKRSSTFLAAMIILASGCHKESTQSSSDKSGRPDAFDIAQAMTMLYGNYSVKEQTSMVSLPRERGSDSATTSEEQMTVRSLFHAFSGDAGAQSFMLLTYAVPRSDETYYCHACAPTIGMAVFSQKGLKWTIDASNRAVTDAGEFGKPPTDIQLVQIGPKRQAVKIRDVGGGNGQTSEVLLVLIPWNGTVNLGLERIIADNNEGACDVESGLPCYSNRRTVTFLRDDGRDYYDLELRLAGTDLPDKRPYRLIHVRGVERLRIKDGKYNQLLRQGDLTSLDRVVAEREGLK